MIISKEVPHRILILVFILSLFTLFLILSFLQRKEPATEETREIPALKISEAPPTLQEYKAIIRQGMTISDILSAYNFSAADIHKLRKEVKPVYDLAAIKAGQEIRIFCSEDEKFISLEYDIDQENYLLVQKTDNAYHAEIKELPYEIRVKMIWGIIEDNPISAVARENEQDLLALHLAEIFAWDIDFYTDLRRGDSFKIIFEKKFLNGQYAGYRNILAAEFTNQGITFQAFRYTYPDTGESDYFNINGDSLRKEFLKSPISFARITSRFSLSRLHPIRKVYRPHYGVDYAARIGTPIQATADGTVIFMGRKGNSGRMISVRHKNYYETQYLHLRNYANGIRKGVKVKGGQVIGYVGSSGESTGPHLDYRIKYRGRYINPLAWRFKPVKPLRKGFLEDFKIKAETCRYFLESPPSLISSLTF